MLPRTFIYSQMECGIAQGVFVQVSFIFLGWMFVGFCAYWSSSKLRPQPQPKKKRAENWPLSRCDKITSIPLSGQARQRCFRRPFHLVRPPIYTDPPPQRKNQEKTIYTDSQSVLTPGEKKIQKVILHRPPFFTSSKYNKAQGRRTKPKKNLSSSLLLGEM